MPLDETTSRRIMNLATHFRHLLTFLAGLGAILFAHHLIDPGAVDAVNKAGSQLIEPLVVVLGAVAVVIVRVLLAWAGKRFPGLAAKIGNQASGGMSGGVPLWIIATAGLMGFCLPSCAPNDYPITGSLYYRDSNSGAKGGLTFSPGRAPVASVRVPIYDPQTGELKGLAELSAPLVKPAKVTAAK